METQSRLTRTSGSLPDLLRATLNQFGTREAIAEHFGVKEATVARWFRAGGAPGKDTRAAMQTYLTYQQTEVFVSGNRADRSGPGRHYETIIVLDREDGILYAELIAAGKENTARVFLLAAQHENWDGVPALAGASWEEDFDYDEEDYPDWPDADDDYILE